MIYIFDHQQPEKNSLISVWMSKLKNQKFNYEILQASSTQIHNSWTLYKIRILLCREILISNISKQHHTATICSFQNQQSLLPRKSRTWIERLQTQQAEPHTVIYIIWLQETDDLHKKTGRGQETPQCEDQSQRETDNQAENIVSW